MKKLLIKYIRSLIMVFMFVLFGFGAMFIRYCIYPFQRDRIKNYETLQKSWKFFIFLLRKFKIISLETDDYEKLKQIKNSIIVSTHPSFIDIVILISIIPHSTCFVAKRLAKNPFLKGMVDLLFILEGQDIETWSNDAVKALENGLNIIIFPMGIRHRKNEFPRIRRGASLIAEKSGKNIVLLKLEQSSDFLQIHQPFYEAGTEPVEYSLKYLGELNIAEYSSKYNDSVTFKTEVTRAVTKILYDKY